MCGPSGELRELTGQPLEREEEWAAAARDLVTSGKAEVVALSLSHRGALLATQDLGLRAPAIMVWYLASGGSLEDAFRYGIAGETAALLAPGTSLAHREDTERLANNVELQTGGQPEADAALEQELDQALEGTFPASDPLAVDTADERAARRKRAERKKRREPL